MEFFLNLSTVTDKFKNELYFANVARTSYANFRGNRACPDRGRVCRLDDWCECIIHTAKRVMTKDREALSPDKHECVMVSYVSPLRCR